MILYPKNAKLAVANMPIIRRVKYSVLFSSENQGTTTPKTIAPKASLDKSHKSTSLKFLYSSSLSPYFP